MELVFNLTKKLVSGVGTNCSSTTICLLPINLTICTIRLNNETCYHRISCNNQNNITSIIPIGNNNKFTINPINRGQPTSILSGFTLNCFFYTNNCTRDTWQIITGN